MANTSKINGFWPKEYLNGTPWNGQVRSYVIPASNGTAVYPGDPVKLEGSGDAVTGLQTCQLATAGAAFLGFVVGFEPTLTTFENASATGHGNVNLDTPQFRAASTRRIAYVVDDPSVLFEAEVSNGTLATTDIGLNASFAIGTPSSLTGNSGAYIDGGTEATGATLELKLIRFVRRADNEFDATGVAASKMLVKINNSQLSTGTGTLGVA